MQSIPVWLPAGDKGYLLFSGKDVTNWILTGRKNIPPTTRLHDVNDCFFIPALHLLNTPISIFSTDALEIRSEDGGTALSLKSGEVAIKSSQIIFDGDIKVNGKVEASGDVKAGDISLQNHKHFPGTYTAPSGGGTLGGESGAPTKTYEKEDLFIIISCRPTGLKQLIRLRPQRSCQTPKNRNHPIPRGTLGADFLHQMVPEGMIA